MNIKTGMMKHMADEFKPVIDGNLEAISAGNIGYLDIAKAP